MLVQTPKFFAVFTLCSLIGMLATYVAQNEGKMMKSVTNGNLDLFKNMREGLIVISEEERNLEFASRPAIALLKQLPKNKLEFSKSLDPALDTKIEQSDMHKPLFQLS